ncbi:hypothetical protein EDEG_02205 [Edhazardia aedis USNM 41457]|uniref:Uncharacterized protein n=1 Tax=Edhazardia aedis (strain USNM 41457) TaxID=1003232 RepID=J9DLH3_EDHAE|nr:hypothetical protein EDEG_02205 [Edhazardia aedis USNM 41457]|eukprot:EJW03440.1 hypothetical protein EDEG_02205 [Edhazardia aedis USNM 41457]
MPCFHKLISLLEQSLAKKNTLSMFDIYDHFSRIHGFSSQLNENNCRIFVLEDTDIRYWKNFIVNFCSKNDLFGFLMNGLERFFDLKYFNCDTITFRNMQMKINPLCNFFYICAILQDPKIGEKLLMPLMNSQNLYCNKKIFLRHFLDAFGGFFDYIVLTRLLEWCRLESMPLSDLNDTEISKISLFIEKHINSVQTESKSFIKPNCNLDIADMRVCIHPENYDMSLCLIGFILLVHNNISAKNELINNLIKNAKGLNVSHLFNFIRDNWIKYMLNYCVSKEYTASVKKILAYIKYFKVPLEHNTEQIFGNMRVYTFFSLLSDINCVYRNEFNTLGDIIVSIGIEICFRLNQFYTDNKQ